MIEEFIALILKETISFLRKNPDFFDMSKSDRSKILKKDKLMPKSISEYLLNCESEEFMSDIRSTVHSLTSATFSESKFIFACNDYLVSELPELMDLVYSAKDIKEAYLLEDLTGYFTKYTAQEVTSEIHSFILKFREVPLVIVQSPLELSNKSEIRDYFHTKFQYGIVEFQKKDELLGGMKILVDGHIVDNSWLSKVKSIELVNI